MHKSSVFIMEEFLKKYGARGKTVLDVGSCDVNGSFRKTVEDSGMTYFGADICEGPNVDIFLEDPYNWCNIQDEYDIVISSSAFEHIEFPWRTILEIKRVMKKDSVCCITAPSRGPEHRFPVDCWRFYPDGMRALAKWAGLKVLDVNVYWDETGFDDNSDKWGDCYCILTKEQA